MKSLALAVLLLALPAAVPAQSGLHDRLFSLPRPSGEYPQHAHLAKMAHIDKGMACLYTFDIDGQDIDAVDPSCDREFKRRADFPARVEGKTNGYLALNLGDGEFKMEIRVRPMPKETKWNGPQLWDSPPSFSANRRLHSVSTDLNPNPWKP